MKESFVHVLKRPKLRDPVLIEGLPGIGLVGKLAADHLIQELKAEKFAELYSPHFMHQAIIRKNSVLDLMKNEFYYADGGERDLIILTGDQQVAPTDSPGHFEVVGKILDFTMDLGVREIITMGGFQVPELEGEPKVMAAITDESLRDHYVKKLEGCPVSVVWRDDEGGAIVGAAGLLLGMGKLRGMFGISLLGESLGYIVDPKAAKAVLSAVAAILDIEVDMAALDERAKETEEILRKVQEMQRAMLEQNLPSTQEEEDRGYF